MPDQVITWDVAPPEVAALTADKKGVEPKADGDATVTAKSGTLSSKITLTVALPDDITVGGITDGGTIAKDATATLTGSVTAKGEAVDGQTVTFTSSDPNIAKVDGMTLTAVAEGPVTITAKSGDLTKDVKLTVGTAAPAGAAADAGKDAKAPAGKDATKAPAGK